MLASTGLALGSMAGGLLGSIFGGGGDVDRVNIDTSGYDKAIQGLQQYTQPVTGMTQAGSLMSQMANDQRIKDLAAQRASMSGNQMTNASNASMFGADRGATERALNTANREAMRGTADMSGKYAQMQNQIQQSDIGMQENRAYDINVNKLPSYEIQKMNALNQANIANANAQAASNQASANRTSGLFSALGGIGGALLGKDE